MSDVQKNQGLWRAFDSIWARTKKQKKASLWTWTDYRANIFEAMNSGGASAAKELLNNALAEGWQPAGMAGWRTRDLRAQGFGDLPLSTIGDSIFRAGSDGELAALLDLAAAIIEAGADVNHSCSPIEIQRWRGRGVISSNISEANALFHALGCKHLSRWAPRSSKEIPLNAIRRLLALGADPSHEINGVSPLWVCAAGAASFNYEEVFAELLDAGARATPVPEKIAVFLGCEGGLPMDLALRSVSSCFAMSTIFEARAIGSVAKSPRAAPKKILRI